MKIERIHSVIAAALAAAFVFFMPAAIAGEEQWSRFRGPNGSGIGEATAIPVKWADADYQWKIELPGVGHSSPVLWGKRMFVTSGDTTTAARIVLCLDPADGHTIWRRDFPSELFRQNRDNSYATATPAADAEGVVVCWSTPKQVTVVALDNDGERRWRRDLGPYVCIHGSGISPIIVGDAVILDNDQEDPKALPPAVYARPDAPKTAGKSFVIALDRKTGKTRWQLNRQSNQAAYITPCLRRTEDGREEAIVVSTAHGVTAVDVATGKINWELGGIFKERCISSPVVGAGLVIAGEGRGSSGLHYVAVRPGSADGKVKPALAYELTQKPLPLVPTPLISGGRLYLWGDDGKVSCVRAASGEPIWSERVPATFYSSPICVNHRLYCASKNGEMFVLADADKFELLGRTALGEKCFATPAVADGVMYIRTFKHLMALGGRK